MLYGSSLHMERTHSPMMMSKTGELTPFSSDGSRRVSDDRNPGEQATSFVMSVRAVEVLVRTAA